MFVQKLVLSLIHHKMDVSVRIFHMHIHECCRESKDRCALQYNRVIMSMARANLLHARGCVLDARICVWGQLQSCMNLCYHWFAYKSAIENQTQSGLWNYIFLFSFSDAGKISTGIASKNVSVTMKILVNLIEFIPTLQRCGRHFSIVQLICDQFIISIKINILAS